MSETKREQNLDLLRIVALAAVILMHSPPKTPFPPPQPSARPCSGQSGLG